MVSQCSLHIDTKLGRKLGKQKQFNHMGLAERFWLKVDIKDNVDDCWFWRGSTSMNGYGNLKVGRSTESAHRISYFLHYKTTLPSSILVRHKCDVKNCVNPHHLEPGTNKQNTQDMIDRGRHKFFPGNYAQSGEKNRAAKLTNADVEQIRIYIADGKNNTWIARQFNVTHSNISSIRLGKSWR